MEYEIDYKELQVFLPYFIDGIEDILQSWCQKSSTSYLMQARELKDDEMINIIGIRVLSYTFDIIEQTESLQYCPYAKQLVEYFDKHNVLINEVFLMYMDLSSVVREYLYNNIPSADRRYTAVQNFSLIFEHNLSDVLDIYFNLQLEKIKVEQKNVLKEKKILEEYKSIVDSTNGVVVCDKDGFISYVNEKFCSFSGYKEHSLLNHTFHPIQHPNEQGDVFKEMWESISNKKIWTGKITNRRKDGSSYFIDATVAPILNVDDEIVEYISLQRDISKEVLQAQKLQELHEKEEKNRLDFVEDKKLNEFLHLIPLASFILSPENTIIDSNPLFEEFFDPFTHEELLASLRSKSLSLNDILSEKSKKDFEKYPEIWTNVYTELYENSPLQVEWESSFGKKTYALRISHIDGLRDILVCLESLV